MALLMGIGMLGIIWLLSFIPGIGNIRLGTEQFIEVDFIAKEKAAILNVMFAEKKGNLQNMELFGHVIAGQALTEEEAKRLRASLASTGSGYMALVNSSGKVVWETGTVGENQFEADIPLAGGLGLRGKVRIG